MYITILLCVCVSLCIFMHVCLCACLCVFMHMWMCVCRSEVDNGCFPHLSSTLFSKMPPPQHLALTDRWFGQPGQSVSSRNVCISVSQCWGTDTCQLTQHFLCWRSRPRSWYLQDKHFTDWTISWTSLSGDFWSRETVKLTIWSMRVWDSTNKRAQEGKKITLALSWVNQGSS